jgi:transcription-repair coupling factor (superfamily II helicase)
MAIIQLVQSNRNYKLAGPDRLVWNRPTTTLQDKASSIRELFGKLVAA